MTTPSATTNLRMALQAPQLTAPVSPPDPALDAVAKALRGARARTGMSEHQVVAMLAAQGASVTLARLRRWERTGVIRVDAACRLADAYGTTIDALAGRRAYRSQHTAGP
jgi:hypothetical protein